MENVASSFSTNDVFTLAIAAYAAVISTFVLGWDAYKWLAAGARVDVSTSGNMQIISGRGNFDPTLHVAVTATNTGDRPTTIVNLVGQHYESWWSAYLRRRKPKTSFLVTEPSSGQRIPYRFDVGDQWIGMVEQTDELVNMARGGYLFLIVCTTGRKGYHRARVRIEPTKKR